MAERIALSLEPDFAPGRWAWSLMGESFGSTGTVRAHDREDAALCVLAAAFPAVQARVPAEIVVTLPPTAQLWSYAAEVEAHFGGVTLVHYTEADSPLRAAAMQAFDPEQPVVATPTGSLTVAGTWGFAADDVPRRAREIAHAFTAAHQTTRPATAA